jgi:hypothetical protein
MALKYSESILGEFRLPETGKWFSYTANDAGVSIWSEYPFLVAVGPNAEEVRYARILKTVAYVVVDEDEYGLPVEEKWQIKHQWSKVDF